MKFSHIVFCALILMINSSASAGPSAHRTQEGSGLLNHLFGTNNSNEDQGASISEPDNAALFRPTENTSRTASKQLKSSAYDGVWKDSNGQILLIKQIHRTLYVSGSSNHAAWQAQCVMGGDSARCIGNGISNTAGEFNYESKLQTSRQTNRNRLRLQSNWTRSYSSGQIQSDHTNFNK